MLHICLSLRIQAGAVSDQTPLAKHVTTTDPPCETSNRNPGLQEYVAVLPSVVESKDTSPLGSGPSGSPQSIAVMK